MLRDGKSEGMISKYGGNVESGYERGRVPMADWEYKIIGEEIVIKTEIPFLTVTGMEIRQEENEHGTIRMQALADEEDAEEILHTDWSGSRLMVYKKDNPKMPLFHGRVCKLTCDKENRFMSLEIKGIGETAELDRKRNKRAFQNVKMTYKQVAGKIIGEYKEAGFIWRMGDDKAIGFPLIQYEETDWEFLKRICSHFHSTIFSDLKSGKPEFFLGMPKGVERRMEGVQILGEGFQNMHGEASGRAGAIHQKPVLELEVTTRENWQTGDILPYRGRRYRVFRKRVVFSSGELIFFYRLGTEGVCRPQKMYHKALAGVRLEGTVQKRVEESVSIRLDMDKKAGADYLWPWAPETNNLCYSMPEVGTKAVLYFPTQEEKDGLVILAAVRNLNNARYDNPQNREFVTAYHKRTGLYPDRLVMEGAGGAVSLNMEDASGISLCSGRGISVQAAGKVAVKGKNVSVTAPMEIECETQDANIEISRDFNFYAPAGIRTVGTGEVDLDKKMGAEAKAGRNRPEHWQLSYRAMGAVPAADLAAFQSKNDIAGLFACGSVAKVAKGSSVIALSEVMKGKKERDTSFPMAFRSMENYVVKGAYAKPPAAAGNKPASLPDALWVGAEGLGILNAENPGGVGENGVESCSCKAHVMCTRASGGCCIHVKKNGEIVKSESNGCELTREDIELENNFSGCAAESSGGLCVVTGGDCIEDGMWRKFENGKEAEDESQELKLDTAYMTCTKGFGMIYFEEYGQEIKEAWDRIGDYVNEEILSRIDPNWDFNVFYENYGKDALEELRMHLFNYRITDPVSIMMFLCTLPVECKHGKALMEDGGQEYYNFQGYDETTCGAGLMQISTSTQQAFLEYVRDNKNLTTDEIEEITEYINKFGYEKEAHEYSYNGETRKHKIYYNSHGSATNYIIENYPIESAVWFWGAFHKCTAFYLNGDIDPDARKNEEINQKVSLSLNGYIEVMKGQGEQENLFLVSQYYVNGSPWRISRLQEMAMTDDLIETKMEGGEWRVHFLEFVDRAPNDWLMRKECWDNFHFE